MQPFPQQQKMRTRLALLIFLKNVGTPIILYLDKPEEAYNELKEIIAKSSSQSPKLVEKLAKGPLKKLALMNTQIAAVALQEEPFIQ